MIELVACHFAVDLEDDFLLVIVEPCCRADSGFFDEAVLTTLEGKRIPYIVAAQLTQPLQRTIYQAKYHNK